MAFPPSSPRASRRVDTILLASIRALVNCRSVCALFAVALTLAGCGSTSTTNVGPSPVKCQVSLSSTSNPIGASGGAATVAVATEAECLWTASEDVTWISQLSPASGQGSGQIGLQVAPNASLTSRQGDILVNDIRFQVLQDAATCSFELSATNATVSAAGGPQSVTITALNGCAWSAASNASWLVVTGGGTGNGNGAVTFQVAPNTGATRSGTLTIAGQTFTVAQDAAGTGSCTPSIQPTSQSIAAAGGTGSSTVTSNPGCAWTAASNAPWLTVTSGAAGSGTAAVNFNIGANTGVARTGTLTIAGQTFTVSQAAPCVYSIQPTSQSITAAGGTGSSAVTSNAGCAWTAASNAPWITVTSGAAGSGNGTVGFSIGANTAAARTGTLTIAGQTFTVNQEAPCSYSIQPTSQAIAAAGGTGSSAVTSGSGCAWTATSNAPWITVTSGATGSGNGTVAFGVAPNSTAERIGTITIAGHTFTVTQATGCSYSIQPTSLSVGNAGGSSSLAVTSNAGCAWTATSNVPWIVITSNPTGSDDGNVTFNVEANTGGARSGTITIATQIFTVNQAAVPCTFSIQPTSQSIGAAGGAGSSAVTSAPSCAWTATSNAPWITVTSGATGSGNGNVTFTSGANTGPARMGTLTIAGQTFTVNQASGCSYSIAPTSQSIGAAGGAGSSAVTSAAGCTWTASSNAPWITVTSGATGSGNGNVTFTSGANTGSARMGTLTIAGQTFTVNQAAGCSYSINPASQSIGAGAGSGSSNVTSVTGCTWTATSNAPWITVTSGASGGGNGTVNFSIGANTGPARMGTLTIAGQTFTVSQANGCTYMRSPASASFSNAGGNGMVTVTTTAGCTWTAVSNAPWITITAGSSGSGNGSVSYQVAPNPSGSRNGTMTVAGFAFTVSQGN